MYFDDVLNDIECDKYINYFESQNNYSDTQVKGSNIIHNSEKAMTLCCELRPLLESKLQYNLQPHQAWIRKYLKGNILHKHWDGRADCAFSIMLGQSDNKKNPLLIYYKDIPTEVVLKKGQGYFFEGGHIEHERPPIESEYLYGLYLGYKKIERKNDLL